MPKISGYPQARDTILNHIASEQPKELDRAFIASMLQVSVSTAGNYLSILANEYPENLQYVRGVLICFSSIPQARLPLSTKLKVKEAKIAEIKNKAKKLKNNHLNHNDVKATKKAIEELLEELSTL